VNGYCGKILLLNLTKKEVSIIKTERYEQWVGGHGMGSAIFWDLVKDKAISGFDSRNVITIMTSPLGGTLVPGAAARTEVQGIGIQSYPIEWFTRSNLGGRFGAMLKYAGWDGIVIEGKADNPVWIDIRNGTVTIKDANRLWGLDTWQTQQKIWDEVMKGSQFNDWMPIDDTDDTRRTTQRPAVLTIGPAGEKLSRTACLIHDAGHASGQGGFGGVWGSKNLKAISVIGTGSIQIADPNALIESRLWAKKKYGYHVDHESGTREPRIFMFWENPRNARLQACIGCHEGCSSRSSTGQGNESQCIETLVYSGFDRERHDGKQTDAAYIATDILQKYGINACEAWRGLEYINELNKLGILGKGKQIDCDLPFDKLGETEFAEMFLHMIAYREGIGDDFAEGFFRAAKKWGRLDEDLKTGLLRYPYWGIPEHGYDPRAEVNWGYSTILGDRDVNSHEFNFLFWWPSSQIWNGKTPEPSADWFIDIIAEKLVPYEGDPLMLDYSTDNIYSEHMAKLVAWQMHYNRFWKQTALYCDYRWPDFVNVNTPDGRGLTGEGESRFLNAVTGQKLSFRDGMELGRKIWNLDNAIWVLQGRHRDMVHFAEYIYQIQYHDKKIKSYYLPGRIGGKWDYICVNDRHLEKAKYEEFKTTYYNLEGWDPSTGWPTRKTLESLELKEVADTLASYNKLGA
jgi:aldehyde:ferredoxin oxidoreductase